MNNIDREKLREILSNPQNFVCYLDQDNWIIFKKKEDIKDLTDEEIPGVNCYYLSKASEFVIDILGELKVKILDIW